MLTAKDALGRRFSLSFGMITAFVVVDLLVVAACAFALRQNVRLRAEVAYDVALLTPSNGTTMPPLLGTDSAGAPQAILYGGDSRPTLIYSFSMRCRFCGENWRAMRPLQAIAPLRLRIVYIDIVRDKVTPEYLAESGIGQSVVLDQVSPTVAFRYNARAVPQLILVGHDGRVQWSHIGELASTDVTEALSLIEH
jgi:hypothetical protein